MIYEIVVPVGTPVPPDLELVYDNPRAVRADLLTLREGLGQIELTVLRDGHEISEAELASDEKSYAIQAVREQATQLPPTYRAGRTGDSDLATGHDGERHGVWRPKNPEDEHD